MHIEVQKSLAAGALLQTYEETYDAPSRLQGTLPTRISPGGVVAILDLGERFWKSGSQHRRRLRAG